jgi:asparagine synthase (glutamine-hydrolysing)
MHSTTLKFEEYSGTAHDESELAAETAGFYGLDHHTRVVSKDEFRRDFTDFLGFMEQPTIDGINTWFVSKSAAELGLKVMLSGVGGDELMGSYPSFQRIPTMTRIMHFPGKFPGLCANVAKLGKLLPYNMISPKYWGAFSLGHNLAGSYLLNRGIFMPWELPAIVEEDRLEEGLKRFDVLEQIKLSIPAVDLDTASSRSQGYYAAIAALESSLYLKNQLLRDMDWTSMAHSVEVRTPLVDFQLLSRICSSLLSRPKHSGKHCLATAPENPLPAISQKRPKTGFTTPIGEWIRSGSLLDQWRSVPILNDRRCHWSRQYAYSVLQACRE